MAHFLKMIAQAVIFFFALGIAMAVFSDDTGAVEKVALLAFGAVLAWIALLLRRHDAQRTETTS